jgi:hypothetical protein
MTSIVVHHAHDRLDLWATDAQNATVADLTFTPTKLTSGHTLITRK